MGDGGASQAEDGYPQLPLRCRAGEGRAGDLSFSPTLHTAYRGASLPAPSCWQPELELHTSSLRHSYRPVRKIVTEMTVGGGGGGGGVTVLACLPLPDRLASLDSVAWSEHSQLAFATRKGVFVYTVSPSRGSRAPSSNQMNFIKTFLRNTDGGGEGAAEEGNIQRPGGELSRLAARVDWSPATSPGPATSPAPAPLLCVLTADHRFKLYRQQGRAWLLHSDPGRTLAGHSRGAGRVTAWTWGEPGILYTAHQGGHLACLQWDQVWLSGLQCQLMVLCSNPL